jgi:2-isopropylmalate synthase
MDAAIGTGPVDAVYKAINRVVQLPNQLIEFSVQSVTAGIDALGEVTIRIRHGDRVFSGHAANTDIVVASAHAYLHALNRLHASLQVGKTLHPQRDTAAISASL